MSKALGPENRKLQSSEPDLVVVVGGGDEQKEYHYYSQVMATHSKVIDAMLASPMRESQTMRINFPDLSAEVWDSMIYFLHPLASRQMTVQDALQIAAAYDMYDFCVGVECCDQVFFELFGAFMPCGNYEPDKNPEDLNQVIDLFLLADAAKLKQTKKCAVRYFKGALNSALGRGRIIFSENQIKKLVPLIAKENLLEQSSFTNDEILQSLFPKLFIVSCINSKTKQDLKAVTGLRLSGTPTSFSDDGVVHFVFDHSLSMFNNDDEIEMLDADGESVDIIIERLNDDWVIYTTPDWFEEVKLSVWWKNPFTANMPLPPMSGWVPVDCRGEPRIEYLYGHNSSSDYYW